METAETEDWDSMAWSSAYINAWARSNFPGRSPKAALTKLNMEELPELLIHLKEHGSVGIGEELADCFILMLDLARIWNVDLARAIKNKMQINERRMWKKDEALGHWNHMTVKVSKDG